MEIPLEDIILFEDQNNNNFSTNAAQASLSQVWKPLITEYKNNQTIPLLDDKYEDLVLLFAWLNHACIDYNATNLKALIKLADKYCIRPLNTALIGIVKMFLKSHNKPEPEMIKFLVDVKDYATVSTHLEDYLSWYMQSGLLIDIAEINHETKQIVQRIIRECHGLMSNSNLLPRPITSKAGSPLCTECGSGTKIYPLCYQSMCPGVQWSLGKDKKLSLRNDMFAKSRMPTFTR
jgi:hypothetical protein